MKALFVFTTILVFNTSLFGQILKVQRSSSSALVDSTLLVQYFKDGPPEFEWFYFPTSAITLYHNFWTTDYIQLDNPSDKSFLRIQVDTEEGYIEISGLNKIKRDTTTISNLVLIENLLFQGTENYIGYYKSHDKSNTLEKTRFSTKTFRKPKTSETKKDYSFSLNDSTVTITLSIKQVKERQLGYSGTKHLWWYKFRAKLLGREPKRFTRFSGNIYSVKDVWIGKLEL